jgi:phospholipid/cholesterol/gamma-HCH transport system substrate-binding protein
MKKEIKVGLLGIITFAIFYLGFNFLKGLDIFRTENEYYTYFDNAEGLQTSNPVTYNGVSVGRVVLVEPEQAKNRIKVMLAVKRDIVVSDKTIAILADNGLLGGKVIKLQIQQGQALEDEATIASGIEKGMVASVTDKLTPTLKNVDSLLTTTTAIVKQFDQTATALKTLMASATQTTNGVNGIVAANSKSLSEITANAAILTSNLNTLSKSLDAQIKPILQNTSTFTDSLNAMHLGETVTKLNTSIAGLQGVIKEINQGKGTLGKLAKDDSLYVNLDRTAANIALLMEDLKENPKRYVHFSLFGRKEKKK